MGNYTELYLSCRLKEGLSKEVVDVLDYLFNKDTNEELPEAPEELPDHAFFKCERWECIGNSSSHYFVPFATSNLKFNNISNCFSLTTRSDLKNYNQEIEKFLNWISEYIEYSYIDNEHFGHFRNEIDKIPTLIFSNNIKSFYT